jgi:hypothetical protein
MCFPAALSAPAVRRLVAQQWVPQVSPFPRQPWVRLFLELQFQAHTAPAESHQAVEAQLVAGSDRNIRAALAHYQKATAQRREVL